MSRNLFELMQTCFPNGSGFDYVAKKFIFFDHKVAHVLSVYYTVLITLPCT